MKSDFANEFENESLLHYLEEINKIPLLTYEEEYETAKKAKSGDKRSRELLISSNLRFVISVAKKYEGQGLSLPDLINEGNVGLVTAADKFDPDKGYHFISYAVWWIKQSIMKALSEKSRMIRLPLNRANELLQIQKAYESLSSTQNEKVSEEDIALYTGLDEELVKKLSAISQDTISLDSSVNYSDDSSVKISDQAASDKLGPDEVLMEKALSEQVETLLSNLSEKERDIIEKRFGFNGEKPMSLKQIGDRYSLTKERIRQIEKKALDKMRELSVDMDMRVFLNAS